MLTWKLAPLLILGVIVMVPMSFYATSNPRFCSSCHIMAGTPEDYHRQLLYVDHLVGQVVARLSASGDFDRSLVVLTADHSWREDPAMAPEDWRAERHVPLLIKLPGQKTPRVLDMDLTLVELRPLIDRTLHGSVGEDSVQSAEALFLPAAPIESSASSGLPPAPPAR